MTQHDKNKPSRDYMSTVEALSRASLKIDEVNSRVCDAAKPLMEMQAHIQRIAENANIIQLKNTNITRIMEAANIYVISDKICSTYASQHMGYMDEISDIMAKIRTQYDFSGITDISKNLVNLNIDKLISAFQMVCNDLDGEEDISIEDIADRVFDSYVVDTDEEREVMESVKLKSKKKDSLSIEEKSLRQSYIQTIIAIIMLLLTFVFGIHSSPNVQNTTINHVQYVNNYYIQEGYSKDFLNECGLRIVNQNIKPRLNPDCSSRVRGYLSAGKVVSVSNKYKKWILITWKDEEGEFISGWIQNYKVSEFQ